MGGGLTSTGDRTAGYSSPHVLCSPKTLSRLGLRAIVAALNWYTFLEGMAQHQLDAIHVPEPSVISMVPLLINPKLT